MACSWLKVMLMCAPNSAAWCYKSLCETYFGYLLLLKVDVRKLKFYYMEDDGGGLLISKVDPQIKAAVSKVTHFNSLSLLSSVTSLVMN